MIEQHDRHDDLQPLARALLVLPAPAPVDVVARGQRDRARDGLARLLHEPADVAPLHVEQHGREQQAVLGRDHRRAARVLDARQLPERDLRAVRRADQHLRQAPADRRGPRAGSARAPGIATGPRSSSSAPSRRWRSRSPAARRRRRCRSGAAAARSTSMFRYWPLVTCSG